MKKIIRAILQWIKDLMKRLAAFLLSGIAAILVTALIMMPVQYSVQWLFDHDYEKGVNLLTDWYLWPILILGVILVVYLQGRFDKWLVRRFGLSQKAGLKLNNDN